MGPISPGWKEYRKAVTRRYGIYTFVLGVVLLVVIPIRNFLFIYRPHGVWPYRIVWTGLLFLAVVLEINNDLMFLVKRLGRVCVALMPMVYFLSLKPTPLPNTLYLQMLPIHKYLSRVLVILATAHGILYGFIYLQSSGFVRKLSTVPNQCGVAALVLFFLVAVTSISSTRHFNYRLFYGLHYLSSWITVGLIWVHSAPPATAYMAICVCMLVAQSIMRVRQTHIVRLPVQSITDNLFFIRLEGPMSSWTIVSHVRLSVPPVPWGWLSSSHPYTVASLPEDGEMCLVVRRTRFVPSILRTYALSGPYDSLTCRFVHSLKMNRIHRTVLVIGGSAIAFGAPLLRYLQSIGIPTRLLWAVRDPRETRVLSMLHVLDTVELRNNIEVYFTTDTVQKQADHQHPGLLRRASSLLSLGAQPPQNDDEDLTVSVDTEQTCPQIEQTHGPYFFKRRLNLTPRLHDWLADTDSHPSMSWVLASGNSSIINDTRHWAVSNNFSFCHESYEL